MQFTGRPNTIRTKESLFKNWVDGYLKPDGSNLDAAVKIWEENLEPNSVRQVLYVAKEATRLSKGVELDIRSHIRRVMRSKQQKMVTALSKEEIVALTPVIRASYPKLYLPYMIALNTGMRRGEVWGLQWDDIDLLNDSITIQRSYSGPTKSGKTRVVPISFALEKALLAVCPRKSYNSVEAVIKSLWDPNPMLRAAAKKAGLRESNLTFHVLRHTFCTMALEAGRSPALVSRMAGHASIATTLSIYWSVSNKTKLDLGFLPDE